MFQLKKFIYSLKILCFRPLLISFPHQNSGTDCMINMARVRFAHLSRLGAMRTAKPMFVCIGHKITQRKKQNLNILHSFRINRNICIAHTITSNVIFHILFNEIFDVANIICTHAQLQGDISLHIIVNIIKFKRMLGLNYLSFDEHRLLFL